MDDSFIGALQRLERWIRANNPRLASILAPGDTDAALRRLRDVVPEIPTELVELFRWHGGQTPYTAAFEHNFRLLSAAEVIDCIARMREFSTSGEFSESWWGPSWVPFMESLGGDYFCVDVAGSSGMGRGVVVWFAHDYQLRTIPHGSITRRGLAT